MKRVASATAVALVVVLAGCSALPGWNPGPGQSDGSETTGTTLGPDDHLAPGLTGAGVTDSEQLAFAHETKLQGKSFTHVSSWTLRAGNGTILDEGRQTVAVGADGNRFVAVTNTSYSKSSGSDVTLHSALFSNGSVTYSRVSSEHGTTFDRLSGKKFFRSSYTLRGYYATLLNDTETDVVGTLSRDGETLYRVVGRAQSRNMSIPAASRRNVTATNVTVTALVDSSGRIHEFATEYDYTAEGRSRHRKQTVRYEQVGATTVERPDWVGEAQAAVENRTTTG